MHGLLRPAPTKRTAGQGRDASGQVSILSTHYVSGKPAWSAWNVIPRSHACVAWSAAGKSTEVRLYERRHGLPWVEKMLATLRRPRRTSGTGSVKANEGRALTPTMTETVSTEGYRLYVLPDMHGRLDCLDAALARIEADQMANPAQASALIGLGDYIDRGPDSAGVIQRLIDLNRSRLTVYLKGNHETSMLEVLRTPAGFERWKSIGAYPTLMSYGVVPPKRLGPESVQTAVAALRRSVPEDHLAFLSSLKTSFTCGSYFFAHAGVRPGIPLDKQPVDDLLQIRDVFLSSKTDHGKRIIHGHSIVREPDVHSNRINLDTGAYATGHLTCLVLEGTTLRFI